MNVIPGQNQATADASPLTVAFFYGTLMVPDIIKRVTKTDGTHLEIAPALLMNHTRHQVKGADYPGVISYADSKATMVHELGSDARSVRGVVVKGFTSGDFRRLDYFEGGDYKPFNVPVHRLAPFELLISKSVRELLSTDIVIPDELPEPITAMCYLWTGPVSWLSPSLWSFEEFLKECLHRRVIGDPGGGEFDSDAEAEPEPEGDAQEHLDVSNRGLSTLSSDEMATLIQENEYDIPKPPVILHKLGKGMLHYFCFENGYVNLNNGSYGSTPKPISVLCEKWGRIIEARPDGFMRRTLGPMIVTAREKVSQLINCHVTECVLVPNASHGIATVLFNLRLKAGDIIIKFSTTYGAVKRLLQYYVDSIPGLTVSTIHLTLPITHRLIVVMFEKHLSSLPRHEGQKIVAIIDGIISQPGVILPWEVMVAVCKNQSVFSVVDAAQCLGQVRVDLNAVQPDFWISNCHKWLFSKRSSAILYVPQRNHRIVTSSFPVSDSYTTPSGTDNATRFADQFAWTGTMDFVPYLSIIWAINFRRFIGGEQVIMSYCRDLAIRGSKAMASILGTRILDDTPTFELTGAMVDVLLPLDITEKQSEAELKIIFTKLQEGLLSSNCYVAPHVYDRQWWARASAQVWLEVTDFEIAACVLKQLCKEIQGLVEMNSLFDVLH